MGHVSKRRPNGWDEPLPPQQRTLGAFLRAIRSSPTFWIQTLAVCSFALASAIKGGIVTMLLWASVGVLLLVGIGYPLFRRRGRIG